jgi:hypothetical protein
MLVMVTSIIRVHFLVPLGFSEIHPYVRNAIHLYASRACIVRLAMVLQMQGALLVLIQSRNTQSILIYAMHPSITFSPQVYYTVNYWTRGLVKKAIILFRPKQGVFVCLVLIVLVTVDFIAENATTEVGDFGKMVLALLVVMSFQTIHNTQAQEILLTQTTAATRVIRDIFNRVCSVWCATHPGVRSGYTGESATAPMMQHAFHVPEHRQMHTTFRPPPVT